MAIGNIHDPQCLKLHINGFKWLCLTEINSSRHSCGMIFTSDEQLTKQPDKQALGKAITLAGIAESGSRQENHLLSTFIADVVAGMTFDWEFILLSY